MIRGKVHGFNHSYIALALCGEDGELLAVTINLAGQEAANPSLVLASPLRQNRPEIDLLIHIHVSFLS